MYYKSPQIYCALDTADLNHAIRLVNELKGSISGVKLGMEFFYANGKQGVKEIEDCGIPIFLDLKLHDIPNTVTNAIKALQGINVSFLTIHITGGSDMIQAAVQAANDYLGGAKILGVSVLTSLNDQDLQNIGIKYNVTEYVKCLTSLAVESGIGGIVCSPLEISTLRSLVGDSIIIATPGIRLVADKVNDQKRTLSPQEAYKAGADILVIGRSITQSSNPAETARNICSSLI